MWINKLKHIGGKRTQSKSVHMYGKRPSAKFSASIKSAFLKISGSWRGSCDGISSMSSYLPDVACLQALISLRLSAY